MDQQHKLALDVGVAFVRDYYSKFAATPEEIIGMYASTSVLSHRGSDEQKKPIFGTADIKNFLSKVGNEGVERKFHLHSLECVPSVNLSVLVVAKGTILMRKGNQDFSQTFILARDPRVNSQGYYIHNDLMQLGTEIAETPVPASVELTTKRPTSPPAKPTQETKQVDTSIPPPQPQPPKEEEVQAEPVKEEAVEEVHEDPEPVDVPAEPEAPAPTGPPSWARVAGAKASPTAPGPALPAKPPAPKEQPKPASPPKERQQQQQQQPKEQTKFEAAAPVSWAGLVAGSVKADREPAQRVIGGREAKEEHKEEKKEAPPKPKVEKGAAGEKREPKGTGGAAAAGSPAGAVKKYQYAALYVSRLPPSMKEGDIDTVFGQFGTILGKTFRPGEFCFIDFDDHSAVKKALAASESDGVYFKTHKLGVQERKSPEQRAREREAGGGGGGKRGKNEA